MTGVIEVKKSTIVFILIGFLILFSGYNFYFKTTEIKSIEESPVSSKSSNQFQIEMLEKDKESKKELVPTINLASEISNSQTSPASLLHNKFKDNIENKSDKEQLHTFKQKKQPALINLIQEHEVKKGENLFLIAKKYNIDVDTLLGANDITNMNKIKPGMKLKILPVKGQLYKIGPGESLWEIARRFNVNLNKIIEANNIKNPEHIKLGKLLILPGAKPKFGYRDRLKQRFISPVNTRITSYFGQRWDKMHEGIDYAASLSTNVKAAKAGRVIYSGWAKGYGKTVIIKHRRGIKTLYAHNSKLLVHKGEKVYRGTVIAKSGNTGRSTGPHLHFEVQINGKPVNPLNYLHK